MKTANWIFSDARRRAHAKFRRHLCRMLAAPTDCNCTTGELLQALRYLRSAVAKG